MEGPDTYLKLMCCEHHDQKYHGAHEIILTVVVLMMRMTMELIVNIAIVCKHYDDKNDHCNQCDLYEQCSL